MSSAQEGTPWINKSSECCTPWGDGCTAFWCPCIIYGRIHHRLNIDPQLKDYRKKNDACTSWFWMSICSLQFIMQAKQREEIISRYGLQDTGRNNLRACCCINCDLLQQDKEIVSREAEKKGLVAEQPVPVVKMAYGGDEAEKDDERT